MLQLCYSYVTATRNSSLTQAWLLMIIFAMSISSCSDELSPAIFDVDGPTLYAKIKTQAEQSWASFKQEHANLLIEKDGHWLLHNEFTASAEGTGDVCHCGVEIISVNLALPSGFPYGDFEFFSPADCSPTDPSSCTYFSSRYSTFEECASSPTPHCVEILTPPFSGSVFSLNCTLPAFAVFPVVFGGFAFIEDCGVFGVAPFEWAEIKFKVHCVGKYYSDEGCTRFSGAATIYSSDEITLRLPSLLDNYETAPPLTLALSGCGCQPDYFEAY
jgi:hypothetical protein